MTSPLYKSPIPLNYLDTDTALTANSDVKVPTQKAVKAYADTKLTVATEANLSLSDNTTNDSSTTKHGLLKKLSNVATEFMNGVGSWVTAVTLDAVQTLTNKTLTSPKINEDVAVVATATEINVTDNCNATEKALNVQSKCKVYLASLQENLTDSTWTKVLFTNEVYDVGGDFDTANSRFVAPVTGYYQVNVKIEYDSASVLDAKRYYAGIYVNGALYSVATAHSGIANLSVGPVVSDVIYVTAGQYIEGYARAIVGASTVDVYGDATLGPMFTYMSIHLLSV